MITKTNILPKGFGKCLEFARIKALYNTYSQNGGAEIFVQTNGAEVTAFFSLVGRGVTLIACDNADFCELNSYFSFLGAEVFCNKNLAQKLTAKSKATYTVYELTNEIEPLVFGQAHKISDIYSMLEFGLDGDIVLPPFDEWYCDFCARYNHGAAEFAVYENSVAVCGFATDEISLITGVATRPDARCKGQAKEAIRLLCGKLRFRYSDTRIMSVVSKDNLAFYEKCGFKPIDSVCVCNF